MSLLITVAVGFAAGVVAKFLMPGKDPGGWIVTTLLGIGGAMVATFLGRFVGLYQDGDGAQFIGAVVGAVIILAVYRQFKKRGSSAR